MKMKFLLIGALLFILSSAALARDGGWIRLASDNGEFSIEVPASLSYFSDEHGFTRSGLGTNPYIFRNMQMANAYEEKTLLSVEIYQVNVNGAEIAVDNFELQSHSKKVTEGGNNFTEAILDKSGGYVKRRYLYLSGYLYVLTGVSRTGETLAMKRFFQSVLLTRVNKRQPQSNTKRFSELTAVKIEMDRKSPPASAEELAQQKNPATDPNYLPIAISISPIVSPAPGTGYPILQDGTVSLRVTFSENGSVSKIGIIRQMDREVTRQAILGVLRIKFIPAEKNNIPQASTRVITYVFSKTTIVH